MYLTPPKKTIYLAGPISGLTYTEARCGWRETFVTELTRSGLDHIFCHSPMRGKEFLMQVDGPLGSSERDYPKDAMATAAGITTRDYNDVKTCDAMVACFLESSGISAGTFMEFGFAWALQKPIIVIGPENDVNVRHVMAERVAGYRVDTIEEGVFLVGHLLTPGL